MTITPCELLDTSIAQLQILVAFLSDQLGDTGVSRQAKSDASELRACREALLSLSALVLKAQVARCAQLAVPDGVSERRRKGGRRSTPAIRAMLAITWNKRMLNAAAARSTS